MSWLPASAGRHTITLECVQRGLEVLQNPYAIARRLAEFRVAVAVEIDGLQQAYEAPPRVVWIVQVVHVDLSDTVLHQPEIGLEPAIFEVRGIRVPAHPQRRRLTSVLQIRWIAGRCDVSGPCTSSCRRTP